MIYDDPVEQMIADNKGLVYYIIDKHFPIYRGDDDMIQCGMIGLWKACKEFNSEISKFATFASKCILNEIIMEFRVRNHWALASSPYVSAVVSLDDPVENTEGLTVGSMIADPVDHFATYSADQSIKEIFDSLNDRDTTIVNMLIDGKNQTEIGRYFGFSQSYTSRIIRNIRKLVRKKIQVNRY